MKKISIITVTYNCDETLEMTIKSIINQLYPAMEYIIIDGKSTDNTLKIINKYKKYINYYISEKDSGISEAFNKGIQAATGDIIGIINSDDLLYMDALFAVNEIFEKDKDVDILYGNVLRFETGDSKGRVAKPNLDLTKLKYDFLIYHPSVFVSKKAYEKYGLFDCSYKNAMDYELISKMYFRGAKFYYLDRVISCFRMGGISERNNKQTLYEHEMIAKRNGASDWEIAICLLRLRLKAFLSIILRRTCFEHLVRKCIQHSQYLPVFENKDL